MKFYSYFVLQVQQTCLLYIESKTTVCVKHMLLEISAIRKQQLFVAFIKLETPPFI